MTDEIEIWSDDWDQFELIDSGNYRRLERYGDLIIIRSEPRAWWQPELGKADWDRAEQVNGGESYQIRFCLGMAYGNLKSGVHIVNPTGYQ